MSNTAEIKEKVAQVMADVELEVKASGNQKDYNYFLHSKKRFVRMGESMLAEFSQGSTILNVGSHFLHSSMILVKLGYKVTGVDVSEFWDVDFVQERKSKYGVAEVIENDLENFKSATSINTTYDVVIFAEILEHITFNPIKMWGKIYDLTSDGGSVYVTTPNSMALPTVLRALKDIFSFNGIGTKVEDIFTHVTYGHHWKEYSKKEIKQYFNYLSPDFSVKVKHFSYLMFSGGGIRPWLWYQLSVLGQRTYVFAPALEIFIKVDKTQGFLAKAPSYL